LELIYIEGGAYLEERRTGREVENKHPSLRKGVY